MKIIKCFGTMFLAMFLGLSSSYSFQIFEAEDSVLMGFNINESIENFTDIYQKLDGVSWGGKTPNIAIENLEKIHQSAHIAATENRIVLVWDDEIIANYPTPQPKDWEQFAEITTALIVKLKEQIPEFAQQSQSQTYQIAVDALIRGLDENGKYVYSKRAQIEEDGRILTSVGLDGAIDERGNFRVTGVYKDSPADLSGIKENDLITTVNGQRIFDMENSFSGFNSGTLKLKLLTPSGNKDVVLRRATIVLSDADVVYRNSTNGQNDLLEIIVHNLTDDAVSIVTDAIDMYGDNVSGIILDLRASSGNSETAMAKMAGLFLGQVPVLRIVEAAKAETEVLPGADKRTNANMVVLVSNTTKGTAEALAAALYENNRGLLIGTPTAGNARIATLIDLKNGGMLELLNKIVKTGNGNTIDGRGVYPLVCLSNIRNSEQQGAFFLNVVNDDFNITDFNKITEIDVNKIRQGCPVIVDGSEEDAVAMAVSVKVLSNTSLYEKLMDN